MAVLRWADTDLERIECNSAGVAEDHEMAIQVLSKRSQPPAGLTHHPAIWPEEFGQSVQQANPRLQDRLFSGMRFPPVLGALNQLYFLQHVFSLVDPLYKHCHSAFEISSIWSLYCPKLGLLLSQLYLLGKRSAMSFQARCRRFDPAVLAQLLLRSLNQALKVRKAFAQGLHLLGFQLFRNRPPARGALTLQSLYRPKGCFYCLLLDNQIGQFLTEFLSMVPLRLKLEQLLLVARVEDLARYFLDFRLHVLQSCLSILPRGIFLCLLRHEALLLQPQIFEFPLYLVHRREVRLDIGLLHLPECFESPARLLAQSHRTACTRPRRQRRSLTLAPLH